MRGLIVGTALAVAVSSFWNPQSEAAGYCPGYEGGKCPEKSKAKAKGRSEYTAEQRKQILKDAREVCIKKYGASSTIYRFDWKKWTVICNTPSGG